jgi:hypothetical protein
VISAFDGDIGPQHGPEDRQFRAAQPWHAAAAAQIGQWFSTNRKLYCIFWAALALQTSRL